MTVRFYQNTDPGAPPLRGNAPGDLLNLLTKCLVEGYGDKPPAGWFRPFIDGHIGVFRQGPGGNDMYLRVDDSIAGTARRHARVTGYEQMSDVNTGSGAFPSSDQIPGGGWWFVQHNGSNGASDARRWILVADEMFFWLIVDIQPTSTTTSGHSEVYYFGSFEEYGPSDMFGVVLGCQDTETGENGNANSSPYTLSLSSTLSGVNSHVFAPRRWDQFGAAVNLQLHFDSVRGSGNVPGSSGMSYPNPVDNRLYMAPIEIGDHNEPSNRVIRGKLPGIWGPLHDRPFERNDTFTGQGDFAGKEFIAWRQGISCFVIETSDTWRE